MQVKIALLRNTAVGSSKLVRCTLAGTLAAPAAFSVAFKTLEHGELLFAQIVLQGWRMFLDFKVGRCVALLF